MIKLKNLLKENSKPKVIKESTRKWAVKVAEVGVVIVDAGNAGEAKRMVAKKMRGGMKDILGVTKALPTRKVGDVAEGGPGSGPKGGDEDNPFDREPSDDELADIEKQFEGKLNETIPAFAKQWKNMTKACDILEKSVNDLSKSVNKVDKASAKTINGLWKSTYNDLKKFKEILSKQVLDKLQ